MARIPRPVIDKVLPGSAAEKAGLQPGEKLAEINGKTVRDLLDVKFFSADEDLELTVINAQGQSRCLSVQKDMDEDLGVDFGGKATFDGIYTCHNNCVFCFVHQQPRGMRASLNLMDDDFRLSYMHGNFITLVGMDPENFQRILEQKLSPLYVSVHATDDDLRAFLLGTEQGRGIMGQLRALVGAGIDIHTQVVACPGLNDGPHLDRTISDLITLGPRLQSISVVPVGLTRYRDGLYDLRSYKGEEAAAMVDQIEGWQRNLLPDWGTVLVHASDEWYVLAGREVPPAGIYEEYEQLENGVGQIRLFLEQMQGATQRLPQALSRPRTVTVVTGTCASGTLQRAADWLEAVDGLKVRVLTVVNDFYGPTVSVAGLLLAKDIIAQAQAAGDLGDQLILPAVAFRDTDGRSLDNVKPEEISAALGNITVSLAADPLEMAEQATGGELLPDRRRLRLRSLRFRHQGEAATANMPRETFVDPLKR